MIGICNGFQILLESGLLPWLIERALTRRASEESGPVGSAWFVDIDAAADSDYQRFAEKTRDNPTMR